MVSKDKKNLFLESLDPTEFARCPFDQTTLIGPKFIVSKFHPFDAIVRSCFYSLNILFVQRHVPFAFYPFHIVSVFVNYLTILVILANKP